MKFGGGHADKLVAAAIKARRPLPPEVLNTPEITENNELVWRCFWDLRRGLDPCQSISWRDVLLWAETYGCETRQMIGLQAGVVILDGVLIPYNVAKRKAEQAAEAARARGGK